MVHEFDTPDLTHPPFTETAQRDLPHQGERGRHLHARGRGPGRGAGHGRDPRVGARASSVPDCHAGRNHVGPHSGECQEVLRHCGAEADV